MQDSLMQKATYGRTSSVTSPPFFMPITMLYLAASAERNLTYEMVSPSVRPRPLSFCCSDGQWNALSVASVTHVSIHVIGINSITSLLRRQLDSLRHDSSHSNTADIHPSLVRPTIHDLTKIFLWKTVFIFAPILPRTSTEVTNNLLSSLLHSGDCALGVLEEIHIPD